MWRHKHELYREKKKGGGAPRLIINNIQSVFFLLGDSLVAKFYVLTFSEQSVSSIFIGSVSRKKNWDELLPVILPVYMTYEDRTECSGMSAHKIQTSRNHPKESIQHSEHGESWNLRTHNLLHTVKFAKRTQNSSSTVIDNILVDNSKINLYSYLP